MHVLVDTQSLRFKLASAVACRLSVVRLRGFKLNPVVLTYVTQELPARPLRLARRRAERLVSKRLPSEAIDQLVAEYGGGRPPPSTRWAAPDRSAACTSSALPPNSRTRSPAWCYSTTG